MILANFDEELTRKVSEIEMLIKKYLPIEEGHQKIIFEAMNYSVLGEGKRLRPMLMQETFGLFGGKDLAVVEPFMAAIEMIHTYSLVHDDLPAMDNDEYRRGRKTTHIVYGEAMGILAGDALLNYAFETACKAFFVHTNASDENIKKIAKAMEILSKKSGVYGMVGGQVIDVEGIHITEENTDINNSKDSVNENNIKNRLIGMYQLKTSALIEASMMIGAVLAGADDSELKIVEQMASDIGVAFQIQDDILDETSTIEVLGKPIHSDERNEKVTYVTLVGIDKAKQEVETLSKKGLSALKSINGKNEYLQELIVRLITREK